MGPFALARPGGLVGDGGSLRGNTQRAGQGQGPHFLRPGQGMDATREVIWPDAIYWPFERLPESKLEAYAEACLEIALKYSEEAQAIYDKIVLSWELPGCQLLIGDFARYKQDTRTWMRKRAESVARNEPPPDRPKWIRDVVVKYEDDADVLELLKYVVDLIRVGFNRKVDLENQMPKVIPSKSPYMVWAIFFYSVSGYLKIRPDLKGPRVISDTELTEFRWFVRTLASNPTTRMSRQVRHQIVRTLHKKDFTLHNYQAIVDGAEMWYRARVLCDTAREAADYYHIDAIDLSKRIEPYDDATGWPRHR